MPLGRARPGLLAVIAIAGALIAVSTSFGSAGGGSGCTPIIRTLQNGDPAVTDGAIRVTVDGLGAFGRGAVGAGDAIFNPSGGFAPLGTTYTSNLYVSTAGRMLADDCVDGQVELLSESPFTTRLTIGSLQIDLSQEVEPVTLGGSTLRQTYTLRNTGGGDIGARLVRHLDGDLRFDSSTDDGAAASGADGQTLTEFDSAATGAPRVLLRITGSLAGDETPDEWTIQPFNYRPVIEGAGGIPPGDSGLVFNDTNGDLVADSPYDVTLSQQWNATVAPGASVVLESSTRFDAENRAPTAVADTASTGRDAPVEVDVRANDSDPDGDALSVVSVTQPQHGTAAIQPSGKIRYTPASGYEGGDSFTYAVGDGRGGTASAVVALTVGTFTLTVDKTGNGRILSTPAGIDCGATCSADFTTGSRVTLVANPDPGWTFPAGAVRAAERARARVTMDAARSVGADFLPPPPIPGKSANLSLAGGTVLYKFPDSRDVVELEGAAQVPVGTQVDTTAGAAKVTVSRAVALDTSEFYSGRLHRPPAEPERARRDPARRRQLPRLRFLLPGPGEEAPGAQALGPRHRPLQDSRTLFVGNGSGNQVAHGRPLRRHADDGRRGHGHRPRLRPEPRCHRPRGAQLSRRGAASERSECGLHRHRHEQARLPEGDCRPRRRLRPRR